MKSKATTVAAYLDSLPPERREALQTVRRVILENLDRKGPDGQGGCAECMQYGVIAYVVPHRIWPHGSRTRPELPLMYMGLSSQKNDMVVYMLFLYQNEPERAWFDQAWKATRKKLQIEVKAMACCLRFRKVADLSLEVISEAMRRMSVQKYLTHHTAALARMGRGPDGKTLKKNLGGAKAKSAPPKRKKVGTKKSDAPRGRSAARGSKQA